MSGYSLDLNDKRLKKSEAFVIGKVMEHIAVWDTANGANHTVIRVQLNNEVLGKNSVTFPASLRVEYMSDLGNAVKNSSY